MFAFCNPTIFSSLARAHLQNVRDFIQTKFYSEIIASFLLNKHADPHFLFHNFNKNNILKQREED